MREKLEVTVSSALLHKLGVS